MLHWRPYLWGTHFIIKTDHYSLKYLLDQRLGSASQQHWISKLLSFDFSIEYRQGRENIVADALSRSHTPALCALSSSQASLIEDLRSELVNFPQAEELAQAATQHSLPPHWRYEQGLLWFKNRLFIPPASPLRETIIASIHQQNHEGFQKTIHRLRSEFYWQGMKHQVKEHIRACPTCQRNKSEHMKPAGLLQPLPIPTGVWSDISIDFIEGLPKSHGKSVILVTVDRFSKYAHFLALTHPYSALSIARLFFDNIVKLHGLPESIVSDRDVIFTSQLWKELFRLSGTKLTFTTAYHPQADGQTEVVNRTLEMYLRCLTGETPNKWTEWLAWAEYSYNTSFHTALRATPFEIVYGRSPLKLVGYIPGHSKFQAIDHALQERDQMLAHFHQ